MREMSRKISKMSKCVGGGNPRSRCGGASKSDPTHDDETVMNGAPKMVLWVGHPPPRMVLWVGHPPPNSVVSWMWATRPDPTHDDETVMNGAPRMICGWASGRRV